MTASANRDSYLSSWTPMPNGTGAREAIEEFVRKVTEPGPDQVPPEERIAVFDNDGTLWSEQPRYFQEYFIEYRQGLDQSVREETVEDYAAAVKDWIETAKHPERNCLFTDLVFQPMLELLVYLRDHGFKTFIISGGGIEFVRPWAEATYGIPPEQVVGSSVRTAYRDNASTVVRLPKAQDGLSQDAGRKAYQETLFIDDKYGKPVGINTHIGRRPIAAFGNSNGDRQMLEYTTSGAGPRFGLLIHHTDGEREWQYDSAEGPGQLTEETLQEAEQRGWTVVDMARDWSHISPPFSV